MAMGVDETAWPKTVIAGKGCRWSILQPLHFLLVCQHLAHHLACHLDLLFNQASATVPLLYNLNTLIIDPDYFKPN